MNKLGDKVYEWKRGRDKEGSDPVPWALMQAFKKFQIEWASIMFGLRNRLQDIAKSEFDTGSWEDVAVTLRATHSLLRHTRRSARNGASGGPRWILRHILVW